MRIFIRNVKKKKKKKKNSILKRSNFYFLSAYLWQFHLNNTPPHHQKNKRKREKKRTVTVFGLKHHRDFKRQFNSITTDLVGIDYNRDESIMPCEIKVLIELYGPIDTGVIIWITNIIGKTDCISFYLPSFDPRFDRHRAFLTFSKRYSNLRCIYVFYFLLAHMI